MRKLFAIFGIISLATFFLYLSFPSNLSYAQTTQYGCSIRAPQSIALYSEPIVTVVTTGQVPSTASTVLLEVIINNLVHEPPLRKNYEGEETVFRVNKSITSNISSTSTIRFAAEILGSNGAILLFCAGSSSSVVILSSSKITQSLPSSEIYEDTPVQFTIRLTSTEDVFDPNATYTIISWKTTGNQPFSYNPNSPPDTYQTETAKPIDTQTMNISFRPILQGHWRYAVYPPSNDQDVQPIYQHSYTVEPPLNAKNTFLCAQWADLKGNSISKEQALDREDIKCTTINTAIGPINTEPQAFVRSIFSIILGLAGGIALLLIMFAGYKMMSSQGNAEQITAARDQFTSAIIGLLFIIFSFVILQIIGVEILRIPGFQP